MTTMPGLALIGRSFSSEAYDLLYQVSLATRAERRGRRSDSTGHAAERKVLRLAPCNGMPASFPVRTPG